MKKAVVKDQKFFEKQLGLQNNKPYSVLKEVVNGCVQQKGKTYGDITVDADMKFIDDNPGEFAAFTREGVFDVSLSSFRPTENWGNKNNPREALYSSKRRDIVCSFCDPDRATFFRDCAKGGSIAVKSFKFSDGKLTFEIPEDSEIYGVFDGQNLIALCRQVMMQYNNGQIDLPYDPDKFKIRLSIREYPEDISKEKMGMICQANNTSIPQSEITMLSYMGKFDRFFSLLSPDILDGFETKENEAVQSFYNNPELCDKKENTDYEENECLVDKLPLNTFFRSIAIAKAGAETRGNERKMGKLRPTSIAKSKSEALKKAIQSVKTNSVSGFEGMIEGSTEFFNGVDDIISFDYSGLSEDIKKTLGIKEVKGYKVTPFKHNPIKYSVPILVWNIIFYALGSLYHVEYDENEKPIYVCDADIPTFWKKNYKTIFKIILKCRKAGARKSKDSYCLCDGNFSECIECWNSIYYLSSDYCNEHKSK